MSKRKLREQQAFMARCARVAAMLPPPSKQPDERHFAPAWEAHVLHGLTCHCKPKRFVMKDQPESRRNAFFENHPDAVGADIVIVHTILSPEPTEDAAE